MIRRRRVFLSLALIIFMILGQMFSTFSAGMERGSGQDIVSEPLPTEDSVVASVYGNGEQMVPQEGGQTPQADPSMLSTTAMPLIAPEASEEVLDDHGNDFNTSTVVQIGKEVQGRIESSEDVDYFQFTPLVEGVYIIESTGTLDTEGYLYDAQKTSITWNRDAGSGRNFYMSAACKAGQPYYVKVKGQYSSDVGQYGLHIYVAEDDYANDWSKAKEIGIGKEIQGEINYLGDADTFKIVPAESGSYMIGTTGNTDTYGRLINATGGEIASSSSKNGEDINFGMSYFLESNKVYFIQVYHENRSDIDTPATGIYRLKVALLEDDHGDNPGAATTVKANTETKGTINVPGDVDYFKIVTSESRMYIIESMGTVNVQAVLEDKNLKQIHLDYDAGEKSNFYMVEWLEAGQTYYIKVMQEYSNALGDYTLKIHTPKDDYGNQIERAEEIALGAEIPGTIDYACDVDMFKIVPSEDRFYKIGTQGGLNTRVFLLNSQGNAIISDNSGGDSGLGYFLKTKETYYVEVRHQYYYDKDNAGTGEYVLKVDTYKDDHGNVPEEATEVRADTETLGSMDIIGDVDYFKFVPTGSQAYTIESTGNTDVGATLLDQGLNEIVSDWNSGEGKNFYIPRWLEEGQTYYIKVIQEYSNALGDYTLKIYGVEDDYQNEWKMAEAISLETEVAGKIDYACDVDMFKIVPSKDGFYRIGTQGNLDTRGELLGSSGNYLMGDSPEGNFGMNYFLKAGQTYYVGVKHRYYYDKDNAGTGEYILKIESAKDDHGNDPESATEVHLQDDTTVPGKIETTGDIDYFKLMPSESGSYTIESVGSTDLAGELLDGDLKRLDYDWNGGEGRNFYMSRGLEKGKVYYLKVIQEYSSALGDYTLKVCRQVDDDYTNEWEQAEKIDLGIEVCGTIEYARDIDVFKIVPPQDGLYAMQTQGSTDTYGILYDKRGSHIVANSNKTGQDRNFGMCYFLKKDEVYYLQISHEYRYDKDNAGTGSYCLTVEFFVDDHGNVPEFASVIEAGTSIPGQINLQDDVDYFKFTPSESGAYIIETTGQTNVKGMLYDSALVLQTSDYNTGEGDNFYIPWWCEADETYYIKVEHNRRETGDYTLQITKVEDDFHNQQQGAQEITLGEEVAGRIEYACDTDVFKFTPEVPGIYQFWTEGSTDTYGTIESSKYYWGLRYSNDNESTTNLNFFLPVKLNAGETYIVYVRHARYQDKVGAGTGAYVLKSAKIEDDFGDDFGSATDVACGKELKGRIDYNGDVDLVRFIPPVSGEFTIESAGQTPLYATLYDESKQSLANGGGEATLRCIHLLKGERCIIYG